MPRPAAPDFSHRRARWLGHLADWSGFVVVWGMIIFWSLVL